MFNGLGCRTRNLNLGCKPHRGDDGKESYLDLIQTGADALPYTLQPSTDDLHALPNSVHVDPSAGHNSTTLLPPE
jgi:hypothetical protein